MVSPYLSLIINDAYQGCETETLVMRIEALVSGILARLPGLCFEIIVCTIAGVLPNLTSTATYNLRQINCSEKTGRARAWNLGLKQAKGQICLFMDGDLEVGAALVEAHTSAHQSVTQRECLVLSPIQASRRSLPLDRIESPGYPPSWVGYLGAIFSVSRNAASLAGGFTEDFPAGVEAEFVQRLSQAGQNVIVLSDSPALLDWTGKLSLLIEQAHHRGQADAALILRDQAFAAQLPLGRFNDLGIRGMLLRRLLLTLRLPVWALKPVIEQMNRQSGEDEWAWFGITLAYWYGVQKNLHEVGLWLQLIQSPIILMYHAICGEGEAAGTYTVLVEDFIRQMRWLHLAGYKVISVEALLRTLEAGRLFPPRCVVITFDDGYRDNYELAAPILQKYNFPAAIFIVAGLVGKYNSWTDIPGLSGRPLLNWNELAELQQQGFEMGVHGYNHRALDILDEQEAVAELSNAPTLIEQNLTRATPAFAYPHGRFHSGLFPLLEQAGYSGAFCSEPGPCDPAIPGFALRRLEIQGTSPIWDFPLAVWLGKTEVLKRLREAR